MSTIRRLHMQHHETILVCPTVDHDRKVLHQRLEHLGRTCLQEIIDPCSFRTCNQEQHAERRIWPLDLRSVYEDGFGLVRYLYENCTIRRTQEDPEREIGYESLHPKDPKLGLTTAHFLLFPRKIQGFILNSREWGMYDVRPKQGMS